MQELRELRRMVHDHRLAEAAPRFVALARREAGNPRIHCEAGFVAQQAGDPASAEMELEAGLRIYERMDGIPSGLVVPYAMCLYNRGLLAEEDLDGGLAVELFRASLELRPNAVVERHLRAAEALPDADLAEEDHVDADSVTRSEATRGGERTAVVVRTEHSEDPGEMEEGCFDTAIELTDPVAGTQVFDLVGACEATISIWRDWADVGEPAWQDLGTPYGWVATIEASHGGRGDSMDDSGLTLDDTTTLHVFAVIDGHWAHGSAPISVSSASDCDNEPCDDPGSTEDDGEGLRTEFENAYLLDWHFANGTVVFSESSRTGEIELPALGGVPIARFASERR